MQVKKVLTLTAVLLVLLNIRPVSLTGAGELPPTLGSVTAHKFNTSEADPSFGLLQLDPPGNAETHALLPGSQATGAGDDSTCPATDQRGVPRPQGAACDIGVYELQQQAVWRDVCAPQRVEITGTGMGDRHHTINPQTQSLADPASVNWFLAQVAGRSTPVPDSVTFTTDAPQSLTLNESSSDTPHGYTFEANLQSTGQITASVSNPGDSYKTPRGLVLYSKRATAGEWWTSVGNTTNHYVYAKSGDEAHTEALTFPPLKEATDLYVTTVVIDNDDDERPMVVEATAGGVISSVTELGPTDGDGLNIVDLTLPQVLTGTSQVSVTLRSPGDDGDSLVLVGLNVSYPCPALAPTTLVLEPDEAKNELPADTSHPFTATVRDQYGDSMEGVLVSFSTDFGHFEVEGNGQYVKVPTDGSGQATVTVVSTMAGKANIRAWVDDGDDTYTEDKKDKPTDKPSIKTWVSPPFCLRIRKILDGAFTHPGNGQDLELGIDLIHVSDGDDSGWSTRFRLTFEVENCGNLDLTDVEVTDVIENQLAPREGLDLSGSPVPVDGLRPYGEDVFGRDTITWTIGNLPAGQSAYVVLLIETLKDQDPDGKYAPMSRDQDIKINRGATVRAVVPRLCTADATTNGLTLALEPTNAEPEEPNDGHISLIMPSLPDDTPWAEATCESVTAATLEPTTPDGANGWYRTPVTVTLTARDAQSGMGYTVYRVNHGHWQTYTTPIAVTAQGTTTVAYYNVDLRGNVEEVQTVTVKIDTTAPSSVADAPPLVDSSPITVTWTATDTASSVASVALWYKFGSDGAWADSSLAQQSSRGAFTFSPTLGDGTYCFAAQATDRAGNIEPEPVGPGDTCCEYKGGPLDYHVYLPVVLRLYVTP